MTLTKNHLINSTRKQLHIPKGRSAEIIESLMEITIKTLESGEDVLISGFGKFSVKEKGKRKGRNPQTGEDLMLRARGVVVFKALMGSRRK